jgi:hypothetical protein
MEKNRSSCAELGCEALVAPLKLQGVRLVRLARRMTDANSGPDTSMSVKAVTPSPSCPA